MLTQVKLTNFKCFKQETTFPLSKFNLLTGVNGSGKSTLLQSLLLMRQSIEHDAYTTQLILNGSCVNLGSFDDVRNREISASEPIFFKFSVHNTGTFEGTLRYQLQPTNDSMSLHILEDLGSDNETALRFDNKTDKLNLEKIHFISADRIGPQEFYQKAALPKFPHVGTRGEFTVNLLDKMAAELVNDELCLGENAKTLITQTEAWLGKILNPLKLEVPRSKTNILELFIGDAKPANVGFGYSSILPIIVSGLIAKPEEKLIVENPEVHLHPKAQSALIQFLVAVANTGVQIFVESHSDHVLNALRIAVLKKQLTPKDVSILYFQENTQEPVSQIPIQEDGRIETWTTNFFDQMDNDLNVLLGI